MRFLQTNLIDSAGLTASTETAAYPGSNVQDIPLASVWRTTTTSGTLVADLGTATAATVVFIANHNLTSSATISLEANSSDSWGAPPFDETLDETQDLIVKAFTSASYRYWRLNISDATNPDGYIKIGGWGLGSYVTMPGIGTSMSVDRISSARKFVTESGQVQGTSGTITRRVTVQIPKVTQAERLTIESFFNAVDWFTPFYVQFDETAISEPALYCTLEESDIGFQTIQSVPVAYSSRFTLMEAK